jgi:hypothetical protein
MPGRFAGAMDSPGVVADAVDSPVEPCMMVLWPLPSQFQQLNYDGCHALNSYFL